MQLSDIKTFNEIIRIFKIHVRFSSHADYHIYTNKRIRNKRLDTVYLIGKQSSIIVTPHKLEHIVRTTLKRYVEMRHKCT